MKATGIVRRIDDLGRVVIPKEIRRTLRIRDGDPLEIFTSKEGGVIFRKYSSMGGVADFADQLCSTLNRTTGHIAIITDRDSVICVAGGTRRDLQSKHLSPELERIMEGRQIFQYKENGEQILLSDEDTGVFVSTAAPILSEGDVLGCVLFATESNEEDGQVEYKLAQSIASFLGKHMES